MSKHVLHMSRFLTTVQFTKYRSMDCLCFRSKASGWQSSTSLFGFLFFLIFFFTSVWEKRLFPSSRSGVQRALQLP